MTLALKSWLVGLILTVAFVLVSIQCFDGPIALQVYDTFQGRHLPTPLAERIDSVPFASAITFVALADQIFSVSLISAIGFAICGLVAIMRRRFSRLGAVAATCVMSTLATVIIKDQLKFAFGRAWPDMWAPGAVSLLDDNVHGFHFFQSGKSFGSFPSGHAAVAAAVLSVLWILLPRLRIACTIGIIAIGIGLVALNLHFLSDVVAGIFLGGSAGLFTVAVLTAVVPNLYWSDMRFG
jgi:membrane-associated phospholipid phosphatase